MTASRGYPFLTVVLIGLFLAAPARADFGFQLDPTDQSDSQTDVAGISHAHNDGGFEHEIGFDGSPSTHEVSGTTLHFTFTSRHGRKLYRRIYVETTNQGLTLRGRVLKGDETVGYVAAQMDEPSTLAVRFTLRDLHARRARSYRWLAWTVLGIGEFDDPCSGEDEGPPVCRDRAPTTGRLEHSLR